MRKLVLLIVVLVPTVAFAQTRPQKVKVKIPVYVRGYMGEIYRTLWREVWVDPALAPALAKAIKARARSQAKLPKNFVPFRFNGQWYYYQFAGPGKARGK